jgi:hypothetical protein
MKARRFVLWSVPLVLAPLAFVHCSGGDAGSVGGDGGRKSDSSLGSGSGSGGGSGGASSGVTEEDGSSGSPGASGGAGLDGSTGGDAGQVVVPPAIPVPEGGAPSDPGYVPCNGAACNVSTNYCCNNFTDGGQSCNAANAGCTAIKQACDESSDCATGNVCCQTINGVGVPGDTACYAGACPATTTFQICRTDGECGADAGPLQKCIPQTCTDPTSATHASFDIEACAVAPVYFPYNNPGPALYGCVAK